MHHLGGEGLREALSIGREVGFSLWERNIYRIQANGYSREQQNYLLMGAWGNGVEMVRRGVNIWVALWRIYLLILKTLLDALWMPDIRTSGENVGIKPNQTVVQSHSQSRYRCREVMNGETWTWLEQRATILVMEAVEGSDMRHRHYPRVRPGSVVSGPLTQRPRWSTHSCRG